MKIEGIVVKVTQKQIVLLCPDNGSFKNVPRSEGQFPLIGGRFVYEEKAKAFSANRWVKLSTVACLLALVLFVFNIAFQPYQAHAAAYVVAIDINPSIEVYADKDLQVVNLKALNKDGEKIIGRINYKGKSLSDTMKLIIDQCVKDSYLKQNTKGKIVATIIPIKNSEQLGSQPIKELKSVIQETLSNNAISAEVTVTKDSKKNLEEAQELKISVNKYKIYRELKNKGIEISVEKVNGASMKELLEMQPKTEQDNSANTPPTNMSPETPYPFSKSIEPNFAKPKDQVNKRSGKSSLGQYETPYPINQQQEGNKPEENQPAAPEETPSFSPEETPTVSPEETPSFSPEETPTVSPNVIPSVSPEETPTVSPEETPSVSPEMTPTIVPGATPY